MSISYIGTGSNIDPEQNIISALKLLLKHVNVTGCSMFYRTKPLLNKRQPEYINGVFQIQSEYDPEYVKFKILRSIEKKLDRKKTNDKYSSRTIDLDLLLYDNLIINNDKIKIPDHDIYERIFIALPLYEIDNKLILPDTGLSIKSISDKLDKTGIVPDTILTAKLKSIIKE